MSSLFAVPLQLGSVCDHLDIKRYCPPGANCLNSVCQCVPPLVENKGKCLSRSELYLADNETMKCEKTVECPLEFECAEKTKECECPTGKIDFLNFFINYEF